MSKYEETYFAILCCSTTSPNKNFGVLFLFGDVCGKFCEGVAGIIGRCLGTCLRHDWEVHKGIVKSFEIVLGNDFRC